MSSLTQNERNQNGVPVEVGKGNTITIACLSVVTALLLCAIMAVGIRKFIRRHRQSKDIESEYSSSAY